MEVAGALASALFAAFSLPCLLLLLVVGETGLRLAALALRGKGCAWPTRSAFLGYRIARSSSSAAGGGGVFQQDELLPPECLDALAVAVYCKGPPDAAAAAVDCVFCLSRIEEGEEVRELRCRHVFHRGCLDAWLLRPRATCPLCRDRLLPSDPPRACAAVNGDDDMYPHDYDLDDLSSSSSPSSSSSSSSPSPLQAVASSYPHAGGALWHM